MGGPLEAAARLGWNVIPALDMRATPAGMVSGEASDFFWDVFRRVADPALASGIDAMFLVLHGANLTIQRFLNL